MPAGSNPFDQFSGIFGETPKTPEKPEKGVAWEAKEWGGKLYVPIDQVHELLTSNGVLPKMCAALKRHMGRQTS